MKKIFSIFLVLFGLSLTNINAQCSVDISIISNENGTAWLFAGCTNPQTYCWDNGSNMSLRPITASGTYTVTVTCTNWESSVASISVNVNGPSGGGCSFNITEQKNCNSNKLTVTDCPDCINWCWSNGAKTSSIDVTNTGTYTVTVTGSGGCTSVSSKEVMDIKKVQASISGGSQVCLGEKTTLTASGGTSYLWSNGMSTPTIQVGKGTYSVVVTGANGCTASVNAQVNEFPISAAPIVAPTINADGTVTLTSSSPSGNMWSNGATSQSITPPDLGLYSLKVKDTNGCYSAASCNFPAGKMLKEVIVPIHDTVILNSPLSCPLLASFMHEVNMKKVNFKNTSSGDPMSYLWMFGDGSTSTEANPEHEYLADGSYEVKLFTFKGTDQNMITGKVFINTKTGNGGGGNATCPAMTSFMYQVDGMNVHFQNTSSGDGLLSYLWDFGDGTSSTEKNPIHKYSKYGTYKVVLYVNTPNGLISVFQNVLIVDQNVLNGTVCDSLLIKASNGMKNGEEILPSQISSQTKLVLEHPNANNWFWSPTGNGTDWSLAKYNVGKHHYYVSYFVNGKKQCSVFDYEILGSGITGTEEESENRSREQGINVYPSPTSGPVQIDLSDIPSGGYMINVISLTSGQQFAKKVIKQ